MNTKPFKKLRILDSIKYASIIALASVAFNASAKPRLGEVDPEDDAKTAAQVIIDWTCKTFSVGCTVLEEDKTKAQDPSD